VNLLIVQTGATLPALLPRHGDFPEWFRRGLRLRHEHVATVRVDARGRLPRPRGIDAAVITGSGAMVTQRLGWSERTADWLRDAAEASIPMLGVCYGHQLLAHAFGGHVDYNPRGREIGTVEIECLPAARHDLLLQGVPLRFRAHATHLQSVLKPPSGAVVLARSSLDNSQAVRFAPRVWGVQFHPEFNVTHMRGYLRERFDVIRSEGLDPRDLQRGVSAAPHARRLLRRFIEIAAQHV
jgi:GMP synthase (glutamine-hydrolysing)